MDETSECVASCPSGFDSKSGFCVRCQSTPENDYCHGACREQHIRSIGDFNALRYCSRVHTLNIYNIAAVDVNENNLVDAFTAFESLEQIDHEFTIHNVNIFSSLRLFSKLRRIGTSTNATMTIEENDFLVDLWPSTQPPPIIQGTLIIVRNARLCLKPIEDLINYTQSREQGRMRPRETKAIVSRSRSARGAKHVERVRQRVSGFMRVEPVDVDHQSNRIVHGTHYCRRAEGSLLSASRELRVSSSTVSFRLLQSLANTKRNPFRFAAIAQMASASGKSRLRSFAAR